MSSPASATISIARTIASSIHASALPNTPPPNLVSSTTSDSCPTAANSVASYADSNTSRAKASHSAGRPSP